MGRLQPRFKSLEQSRTRRSPADLHAAAVRHFLSKRYGAAEDRCRQALTRDPKHADSLHLLGLVHWQTNSPDLAVDLIASAIRCNPNNHEYFLNLGELLREQNKLDEARKSFDIAIKLAPDRAAPWIKLGNLLRIQRRYDEVLLTYEHAFTLDPNNAEASALSGGVLLELGRYEEALAKCDLSLAISPDQVEALCVKGDCLHNLGRNAEAAASYRRASELEPGRVSAWRLLGKVLEQLGDRDGAILALRRARELDPSDAFGASVELMRLGADEVSEMPAAYVRRLFDQYADTFDTALLERLGYRGPQVLLEAVRSACLAHRKPAHFRHAIDLGCGTGLAAAAFAEMVDRFTGIDLSPAMIEKARATGLYAQLKVTDMLEGLRSTPDSSVEFVLSADAMVYVADLFPVLKEASRVLAAGGLLAFTLERHDGDGFTMGEGRRYAHSASYVRASIEAAGLVVLQLEQQPIRTERGVPVPSLGIVAEKS
ncbi:tetratricopeptide repeat protein [Bradyrhizobium sp.]|jgi:predicted TPR repeat methyltransferase|uniref:tetratricopeptide repeat protein n=1 Tax=Bradyrhizobium sp. TaxID=376 RepID=UPI002E00203F|nr:tetratricopeptide repeat protein [Bradyrhizobium sp.]